MDAENPPSEQIRGEREAISISARHVDDRLETLLDRDRRCGPRGRPRSSAWVVTELHEPEPSADIAKPLSQHRPADPFQCAKAGREDEPSGADIRFQLGLRVQHRFGPDVADAHVSVIEPQGSRDEQAAYQLRTSYYP